MPNNVEENKQDFCVQDMKILYEFSLLFLANAGQRTKVIWRTFGLILRSRFGRFFQRKIVLQDQPTIALK